MSVLYLLIGFSFLVAAGFLIAFLWAVKSGQFEDSYTPSVRMLFDDELKNKPEKPTEQVPTEKTLKIK
ncbi:MAG TPA: cbb3-type cytochrome oxidase assembly protein CcoS [Bacteroidales bacterium]|nr:cbb3-type cytochrome oxidase assembly protein CcoS [Bacteroidales bacterium]